MTESISQKRCSKCGNEFLSTSDYFHVDRTTPDNLTSACKLCRRTYVRAHRATHQEQRRAYRAAYYAKYREQELAKHARYVADHREEMQTYDKAYHALYDAAHQEQIQAYRNSPEAKEVRRNWLQANRDKTKAYSHTRRALKQGNGEKYSDQDIKAQYEGQKGKCYYCAVKLGKGRGDYHVDHLIPLSRGGSNDKSNIVIACPPCNLKKADRCPWEWPEGGRLL